jgi:hypothetical protein
VQVRAAGQGVGHLEYPVGVQVRRQLGGDVADLDTRGDGDRDGAGLDELVNQRGVAARGADAGPDPHGHDPVAGQPLRQASHAPAARGRRSPATGPPHRPGRRGDHQHDRWPDQTGPCQVDIRLDRATTPAESSGEAVDSDPAMLRLGVAGDAQPTSS